MSEILTYRIILKKEPEGTYKANVPALPGCITYGDSVEDAMNMAKEAIELYLEELKERGEKAKDDSNTLEYSINISA
jgi:predicted RNase H-like HicB family nuclease